MNQTLVHKFKKRWAQVQDVEHEELLHMSVKEKLLKSISAMQLGFALGYSPDKATQRDIETVRLRWNILKNLSK